MSYKLGVTDRAVRKIESGRHTVTAAYLRKWLAWARGTEDGEATVHQVEALFRKYELRNKLNIELWWPAEWGTLGDSDRTPELDEEPMRRRAFLAGGLAVSAAGLLPAGATDLRNYEHGSAALRHAYQRMPAHLLQPRVKAELDSLNHELAYTSDEETLRRLLTPYAELHLLSGWMQQWDLADPTTAAEHARQAAQAARQAGSADVLAHAYALYALAQRPLYSTCRNVSVEAEHLGESLMAIAQARKLTSGHRPATKAYIHIVSATVNGTAGDERQTHLDLDAANEALSRVTSNSAWPGVGVWERERAVGYEASALRRLGDAEGSRAVMQAAFDEGVFETASRCKYRPADEADHAETMLALGEPDEAVRWAMAAHSSATATGYTRVIGQIRDLHSDLAQYDTAAVRGLGELLHA